MLTSTHSAELILLKYQAVLEKQSYMLIGRHDIENLLRIDPASACLTNSPDQRVRETNASDAEIEKELSDMLLNLRPIKQVFSALSCLFTISTRSDQLIHI